MEIQKKYKLIDLIFIGLIVTAVIVGLVVVNYYIFNNYDPFWQFNGNCLSEGSYKGVSCR